MFQNHEPERTVVEIEVAGEENICTGIVRSLVVAYETEYPKATSLADRYEVDLVSVDSRRGLAAAL